MSQASVIRVIFTAVMAAQFLDTAKPRLRITRKFDGILTMALEFSILALCRQERRKEEGERVRVLSH